MKNDSTLADMILDYIGEMGQIKRKAYQRRLPENPSLDYYYIIRDTGNAESILVEYGFIDNKNDAYKLANNLDNLVEGAVKAIAKYLGVNYTKPNTITDTYTVQKGDTLYSISRKYNISVDKIIKLNNLTSTTLKIGQILKLNEETSSNTHIVQRGDTLYSIADKYNTTVQELKDINNLMSNILSIGQIIYLPEENDNESMDIVDDDYDIYIVKKGDSLWSISRKYDITVDKLVDLNNLKDLTIKLNQSLLVPKVTISSPENTYTVQKGDTLWSISNNLNIPIQTLKELNNLDSNLLSVGQQLIIQ